MVDLWGVQRMAINLVLVVGITLVLAFVSWHLVEKPSMWLKDGIIRKTTRAKRRTPKAKAEAPMPTAEPAAEPVAASRVAPARPIEPLAERSSTQD